MFRSGFVGLRRALLAARDLILATSADLDAFPGLRLKCFARATDALGFVGRFAQARDGRVQVLPSDDLADARVA